jgi:hypothetical protein
MGLEMKKRRGIWVCGELRENRIYAIMKLRIRSNAIMGTRFAKRPLSNVVLQTKCHLGGYLKLNLI